MIIPQSAKKLTIAGSKSSLQKYNYFFNYANNYWNIRL